MSPTGVAAPGVRALVLLLSRCAGGSHACPPLESLHRGFARFVPHWSRCIGGSHALSPTGVAAPGVRTLVLLWSRCAPAILLLILPQIVRLTLPPAKLQVLVLHTFNGVTRLAITCTFAFIDLMPYRFYEITVLSQVLLVGREGGTRPVAVQCGHIHGHTSDM